MSVVERHLKRLEAHDGAVSTVHDEVFAVVPQQTVGHVAPQLLRPPGHLLPLQRRTAAHLRGGQDRYVFRELEDKVNAQTALPLATVGTTAGANTSSRQLLVVIFMD